MSGKEKIIVWGAGGHGKVILDILIESDYEVVGFIDDNVELKESEVDGYAVLGDSSYLGNMSGEKIALGIGDNRIREKVFNKIKQSGWEVLSTIHPKSIVSRNVKVGEGVVVMPGAVVNSNAVLEDGCVVNTGATVDHDCHIGRFAQVWPGAHLAGMVKVGEFSYIGTGASVIQNIIIGKNVIIGAGAAVVQDIPDNVTAVGVPARIIKEQNNET